MKIEMKGINKSFGQNQVLKDAGFVLDDGEVHALMGENGRRQVHADENSDRRLHPRRGHCHCGRKRSDL